MFLEAQKAHQSQLPTATRIYPDEFHPGENPFKGPALWERTPDSPKIATTLKKSPLKLPGWLLLHGAPLPQFIVMT